MEYAGPSLAAFDIANHFVEFVGCGGNTNRHILFSVQKTNLFLSFNLKPNNKWLNPLLVRGFQEGVNK